MAFETQIDEPRVPPKADGTALRVLGGADGLRALIGLAIAVTVFQICQGLNSDSSWLMTVAERWLGGARAYVDILESNPPSSFLPLVPALILAHLTGLSPEPITIGLVALAAVGVSELTVRLCVQAGSIDQPARMRMALGFALLVLPVSIFAEREHIAVIAIIPMWAAMVVRAEGRAMPRALMVAAGIGGGLAMCVKPQFALLIFMPALVAARARRDFTALFAAEFWVAAGVAGGFAFIVMLAFPAYAAIMVPLVIDLYRPIREPIEVLIETGVVLWSCVALIGLALVARERLRGPRIAVPVMAALGGGLIVLEQGKGFGYHYYPMVAALVPALIDRGIVHANACFMPGTARDRRIIGVVGFLMLAVGLGGATLWFYGISKPMAALVEPIRRLSPSPKLVSITPHIWLSHPLVRDLGGSYVGSVPNDWMTLGALYRLGSTRPNETERHRLEAVIASDKARASSDIARGRPDVILVEHDDRVFPAWFASDAELVAFLSGYRRAYVAYDIIDIWVRDR